MCIQKVIKISHMVEDLRQFHIFTLLLRRSLSQREFASVLTRSCQVSVCQNNPSGVSAVVTTDGRTVTRTHNVILGQSSKVNFSFGRLFYESCNISQQFERYAIIIFSHQNCQNIPSSLNVIAIYTNTLQTDGDASARLFI